MPPVNSDRQDKSEQKSYHSAFKSQAHPEGNQENYDNDNNETHVPIRSSAFCKTIDRFADLWYLPFRLRRADRNANSRICGSTVINAHDAVRNSNSRDLRVVIMPA
jgi:hypothetical protein